MHMSGWVAGTPLSSGLGKFMELARCSPMSSAPKLPEPDPLLLVWRKPTAAAWGGGGGGRWGESLGVPLVLVAMWLCRRLADTSRATIWRSSAACNKASTDAASHGRIEAVEWSELCRGVVVFFVSMHATVVAL